MIEVALTIWFFIIFIPGIYLTYNSLKCFDFSKILRSGKVKEFRIIHFMLSVIMAFLFAYAFTYIIERIAKTIGSL